MAHNVVTLPAVAALVDAEAAPVAPVREWPTLDPTALHGIAGEYVRRLTPETEADPVGILVQCLVMFGNLLGRGPHFRVEADEHHLNLFTVLVGESSKGRKGVSAGQAKRLVRAIDPVWTKECLQTGLSSGEGLIHAVRDATTSEGDDGEIITVDPGVTDKRLCIVESEFAAVLKQANRQGNILSTVVRDAWDGGDLRVLTKHSPTRATGAHISIIGHVTKTELLRHLDTTEAANGFGNRFLWCLVRRTRYLSEGGRAHLLDFDDIRRGLERCVALARRTHVMARDTEAKALWAELYRPLSEGKPGLVGSMIGRAEAQTLRLACLYALLDESATVRVEHLLAAVALWQYCEDSARWIFEDALGDPVADEILRALRHRADGMNRTEISHLFGRHRRADEISRALAMLADQGLVRAERRATGGRPSQRWFAEGGLKRASAKKAK